MERSSAKLDPRELYQLKWLLGQLLALLSLWTVFGLGIGAEWLTGGIFFTIAASLLFPRLPGRVPAWLWRVVPFLLILGIIGDFLQAGSDFIPPLIRMIVLLLAYRALEYRTRRQDLQLVLLTLFVVIITGVLTLQLSFALQILLYTPAAMLLLFLVNLSEPGQGDGAGIPADPWRGFRRLHFLRRLRRSVDGRLLLFVAALFAGTTATAGLLFVALPRFELGQALPFLRLQSQQSLSGFSETVEFGEVVDILEDDSVALRADVSGGRPTGEPYWRILALDEYHGNGFRLSESAREANRRFSDHQVEIAGSRPAAGTDWTVYLESGITRFLPTPGRYREVRFQSRQDLNFNPWLQVLGLEEVPGNVLFFQLSGLEQADAIPAVSADRELFQAIPAPIPDAEGGGESPRYPLTTIGLARGQANREILDRVLSEITGNQRLSAQAFAERAVAWLQARHGYAMRTQISEGPGDLLVRWLESDEGGHCELFAGAFLLLAREAGYPARLVTGFRGGDWNGFENYYMVRNSDAHAWVELFDGQSSWLRVDPTPARSLPGEMAQTGGGTAGGALVDRTWGAYIDSLRVLWYRRIVNFDQQQQQELLTGAGDRLRGLWQDLRTSAAGWWQALRQLLGGEWNLALGLQILRGLIVPLGMSLVVLLLWRFRGGWRLRGGPGDRIRRRAGQHLSRLRRRPPEVRAREPGLEDALLVLRYDRRENWTDPIAVFRRAARLRRVRLAKSSQTKSAIEPKSASKRRL